MSAPLLDLALLQTLVSLDQWGTLAKAADRVGRTPSAVSLQMQRLEYVLGVDLFHRGGRALVLNNAGRSLLVFAQKMLDLNREAVVAVQNHSISGHVRFGMSVDFEHTLLPLAMARFARAHPHVTIELRVDRNMTLEESLSKHELDIILIFAPFDDTRQQPFATAKMAWIASKDFAWNQSTQLPLILLEPPCFFRSAALQSLERSAIEWRLAVSSPGLAGLWATALAGIGVTVRSELALPPDLVNVGPILGLPILSHFGVHIRELGGNPHMPRTALRNVLEGLATEFHIANGV